MDTPTTAKIFNRKATQSGTQSANNVVTSQRGNSSSLQTANNVARLQHFKPQPQTTWQLDNVVMWQRGTLTNESKVTPPRPG